MSRVFTLELNGKKRDELADLLEANRTEALETWQQNGRVQNVLNSNQISPDFFIKHFGLRVLNYFIGVLRQEKAPGQCPVIMVMLKFFAQRQMKLEDIYQICSGMKNSVVYTLHTNEIAYSDDKTAAAIELFDTNFSGVIREYIEIYYSMKQEAKSKTSLSCRLPLNMTPSATPEENTLHDARINHSLLEEYFAAENDEENPKILFRTDDADDMLEYFSEISERLSLALVHSDQNEIRSIAAVFSHVSSILLHYSPFLDSLAGSMSELSTALYDHSEAFMEALKSSEEGIVRLFDAVNSDMDRYIQRFSVESMAMKNSHHIHEPTTLSIRQIITLFSPDEIENGEIEFF